MLYLQYYQRFLTRQMEFKDKVIQKLLDDLNEFKDICIRNSRNNLEMVNNTLSRWFYIYKLSLI